MKKKLKIFMLASLITATTPIFGMESSGMDPFETSAGGGSTCGNSSMVFMTIQDRGDQLEKTLRDIFSQSHPERVYVGQIYLNNAPLFKRVLSVEKTIKRLDLFDLFSPISLEAISTYYKEYIEGYLSKCEQTRKDLQRASNVLDKFEFMPRHAYSLVSSKSAKRPSAQLQEEGNPAEKYLLPPILPALMSIAKMLQHPKYDKKHHQLLSQIFYPLIDGQPIELDVNKGLERVGGEDKAIEEILNLAGLEENNSQRQYYQALAQQAFQNQYKSYNFVPTVISDCKKTMPGTPQEIETLIRRVCEYGPMKREFVLRLDVFEKKNSEETSAGGELLAVKEPAESSSLESGTEKGLLDQLTPFLQNVGLQNAKDFLDVLGQTDKPDLFAKFSAEDIHKIADFCFKTIDFLKNELSLREEVSYSNPLKPTLVRIGKILENPVYEKRYHEYLLTLYLSIAQSKIELNNEGKIAGGEEQAMAAIANLAISEDDFTQKRRYQDFLKHAYDAFSFNMESILERIDVDEETRRVVPRNLSYLVGWFGGLIEISKRSLGYVNRNLSMNIYDDESDLDPDDFAEEEDICSRVWQWQIVEVIKNLMNGSKVFYDSFIRTLVVIPDYIRYPAKNENCEHNFWI